MSNAVATTDIVSLDAFRRSRGDKRTAPPRLQSVPMAPPAQPVWVYWVPVWVW